MPTSDRAYTPPKGRPTAGRDREGGASRRIPPTLEWVLVGLVIVAVIAAAWYFAAGGGGASTPHNGAPAAANVAAVAPITTD